MKKMVAIIEGEDSSPELMQAVMKILQYLNLPIDWNWVPAGQKGLETFGDDFPLEAKKIIDASDAAFFGSTNGLSKKALFYLRWGKKTFANVRPIQFIPGCRSPLAKPQPIDFVIVRENLEDLYLGIEGDVRALDALNFLSPHSLRALTDYAPAKYALKVISERGSELVIRYAFELARKRKADGKQSSVACGCKHNILCETDGLFHNIAVKVAHEYPDIDFKTFYIDDLAHRLVLTPHLFDVIVMPNLYGDILSDLAAALVGGLGLAPSGCYGQTYAYFEPAHGSAPDIAGKNIINPTATILSAAMMLEYLGFIQIADKIRKTISHVYAKGEVLTFDQGGQSTTNAFCDVVLRSIDRFDA